MTEQWQELKETITELRDNGGTGTQQEVCKFLVNYMGVLEKQMQEPCEDCVSRQAVLDQTYLWSKDEFLRVTNPFYYLRKRISDLPSVTPQPKMGRWVAVDEEPHEDYECDKCGYGVSTFTANIEPHTEYKYCPNCGAKMESEDKE